MALALRLRLRLRRAVAISGSLLKDCHFSSIFSSVPPPLTSASNPSLAPQAQLRLSSLFSIQTQSFRSSTPLSNRRMDFGNLENEIKPDDILFEGCDYNHWLITMDFPKDPKPTPEEMVETYVQTCAKVVGSVEEAKKKMYACSTTTYNGFQAVMTEEMSEKFRGLPGVVFILPDSYIDPVNKEYGGDKYENGVITPRPPPIQYGRRGRYDDRNRNYEQPRYDRQREPMQSQQGYPPKDHSNSLQGDGRSYNPQQNYGQSGQDGRGYGPSRGRDFSPSGDNSREPMQSQQGYPPKDHSNSLHGDGRSYNPQQNYGQSGQDGRGYGPPRGRDFSPSGDNSRDFGQGQQRNFGQDGGRDHAASGRDGYQWERRDPMTPHQRDFGRGQQGNYAPQEQRNFSEGQRGDYRYAGPSVPGDRQGAAPGSRVEYRGAGPGYSGEHRQGPNFGYSGDNKQGAGSGYGADFKQGSDSGYGQNYPGPVEGQSEP